MISLIESATKIYLSGPSDELDSLERHFRLRPENYWMSPKYQLYISTDGKKGWDGWVRPLSVSKSKGQILRGRLPEVIECAYRKGIELDTSRLLGGPFAHITPDDIGSDLVCTEHELDEHQRACVSSLLKNCMGMVRVVTSGGKTLICATAASFVKKHYPKARFLYLCPTERLVTQVYSEMQKFLPDWSISKFGGGSSDPDGADMVVATDAMLRVHFRKLQLDKWFQTFKGILNDECHYSLSATRKKILLATPAFFRFACSDTTKQAEECNAAEMLGLCGPILHSVEAAPLIESGRVAQPNLYAVEIPAWKNKYADAGHRAPVGSDAYALVDGKWRKGIYAGPLVEIDENGNPVKDKKGNEVQISGYHTIRFDGEDSAAESVESTWCLLDRLYDRGIIRFGDRNKLIAEWAHYYAVERGWQTLVIATRTLHVYALNKLISDKVGSHKTRILLGEDSAKKRDSVFEWFKNTPGSVLISPLVKVGVSLPFIRGGVVADHVVDVELMRQYIGRFMRRKTQDENTAHVTFFIDTQNAKLRRNSNALLKSLLEIRGYNMCYPVAGPETIETAKVYSALI